MLARWWLAGGLMVCAAASAQEPSGARVPGVTRDCAVRQAELEARQAELARLGAAVQAETAALARTTEAMEIARGRAEASGAAEVEAYNARLAGHNRDVAANNERVRLLNAQSARFNAEAAAAMAECNQSLRLSGATEPRLEADERAVLAAVLGDRLQGLRAVVLENRTATFLCSRSLPDLVQFDGCSGMRGRHESEQEVASRLERAWPGVSEAALADLLAKAGRRARIDEPLDIAARQVLRGYGERGGEGGAIDATVKVSRVGLDAARGEAVAFIAVRPRDRRTASAEYVRLTRAADGAWRITGRMEMR